MRCGWVLTVVFYRIGHEYAARSFHLGDCQISIWHVGFAFMVPRIGEDCAAHRATQPTQRTSGSQRGSREAVQLLKYRCHWGIDWFIIKVVLVTTAPLLCGVMLKMENLAFRTDDCGWQGGGLMMAILIKFLGK